MDISEAYTQRNETQRNVTHFSTCSPSASPVSNNSLELLPAAPPSPEVEDDASKDVETPPPVDDDDIGSSSTAINSPLSNE